jgi:RNA polymerase sigma-70 factor (ECF subfamily)
MATTSPTLLHKARDPADADAWYRLTRLYTPLLLDWAARLGVRPADADDMVQEVLVVAARELPRFRYDPTRGSFRGWLRTVLANRVRHHRRSLAGSRDAAVGGDPDDRLAGLADGRDDLADEWDREHDRYVVGQLLAAIRPDFEPATWEAFRLTAVEGRSAAEAAVALGVSVNAVRVARCRVLARLRRAADGLVS